MNTYKTCCKAMQNALEDPRIYVGYDQRYREYYIETQESVIIYVINYCPWCAQKLPENLTDKWFEILENEYGLDDPDNQEQQKLVPDEFKTDEWWIKRSL